MCWRVKFSERASNLTTGSTFYSDNKVIGDGRPQLLLKQNKLKQVEQLICMQFDYRSVSGKKKAPKKFQSGTGAALQLRTTLRRQVTRPATGFIFPGAPLPACLTEEVCPEPPPPSAPQSASSPVGGAAPAPRTIRRWANNRAAQKSTGNAVPTCTSSSQGGGDWQVVLPP